MKYLIPIAIVVGIISGVVLVQKLRNLGNPPARLQEQKQPAYGAVGSASRKPPAETEPVEPAPLETPPLALQMVVVSLRFATAGEIMARIAGEGKALDGVEIRANDSSTGLVLSGTDLQRISMFGEMIKAMDVSTAVVGIRCVILRDDSGKSLEEGLFAFLEGVSGDANSSWGDLLSGVTYDLLSGVASFGSAIAARHVLDLVVSCVAGNSNYHVLAEPNVSVLSGRPAIFSSGREVPVPVTTRDVSGSETSIEYKKAEFRFEVLPVLLTDGTVRLTLKQSNSDVLSEVQISGDKVPVLSTQALESSVDLREDQLLFLGGIHVQTEAEERRGVPGLRDIPVLGFVFGKKSVENKKSELSVLLSVNVYRRGETPVSVRRATPAVARPAKAVQKGTKRESRALTP